MKPTPLRLFAIAAVMLPALAFAAQAGKTKKRPAAAQQGGDAAEVLKPFDKNENHQIDADELVALQKSFAALKKLDKNSNGEIEQAEVEIPKSSAAAGRGERAFLGLSKADKNGNRKIDADEVEELQKVLAGGKIMTRLDQNGNGKLEPSEVEVLNRRIGQHRGGGKPKSAATPPPTVRKAPEKPAEAPPAAELPKTEEKKDKPAEPAPAAKPPGNFGN
ncbi:MAG: EF-hand domain-containing protein [Prosthecobacter sp.]|uniref:EF-hand domain-containing protein n=1 Tax=Prosthecobacter sp. TaxID=1965333 RepID=UPI0038FE3341